MKIILTESVDNLGTVGDVVTVRNGYARNFLIPKKMAILANPKNIKVIEHHKKALEKKRLRALAGAEELAGEVNGMKLAFKRKAAEQNQIFGSVTNIDIENELQKKGLKINRKQIILERAIKSLGVFPVTIKFQGGIKAQIQVEVEKDAAAEA